MMNSSLFIFQTLQAVILISVFFAWPVIIKKIASARKFESIDPIEIQKIIRLRWRYGTWILMVWVFLKLFNQLNF
jgi:hypothetical protein